MDADIPVNKERPLHRFEWDQFRREHVTLGGSIDAKVKAILFGVSTLASQWACFNTVFC
jgi:hypothetical protein